MRNDLGYPTLISTMKDVKMSNDLSEFCSKKWFMSLRVAGHEQKQLWKKKKKTFFNLEKKILDSPEKKEIFAWKEIAV